MNRPPRTANPASLLGLSIVKNEARAAEQRIWMLAERLLHDEQVTAEQVARTLKCSVATVWRKIEPWRRSRYSVD